MRSKPYFITAAVCAVVGCCLLVTSMLLPSWLTGCTSIRRVLNESILESTLQNATNKTLSDFGTSAFPTGIAVNDVNSSTISNASKYLDETFCVKQAIFMLYIDIAGHSASLRLIVAICISIRYSRLSEDPTLVVVASINLIISIICSAFAFFALITALAADVNGDAEKQRAKKNCIIGMILLLIAGILSSGGMCSYTMGSQDLPFEHFATQVGEAIKTSLSVGDGSEESLTLSSKVQHFIAIPLRSLSYNVKYSYAWYLGWIGAASLCISTIFAVFAKRKLMTKPGQYTSMRAMRI